MFEKLKISQSDGFKKHLNKYDVIQLDIQWCINAAGGADQVVSYITEKTISELQSIYPEVLTTKNQQTSLPETLAKINVATGNKFVVIIDEWDVLIRDESANLKIQEEYINFLRGMFKGTEPTKYIRLAFLTGILAIIRYNTLSSLNFFDDFTMLSASNLAPYIGFTEEEVRTLALQYNCDFEEVKRWYDGYILSGLQIYNPRAVVGVMRKGEF